jgi:hypothetical protein
MPAFGGLTPYPRRCGGGEPRAKLILGSLNAAMGTAYATDDTDSVAYARNVATAREIAAAWGTNERVANLWDPRRTSVLARWEKILGITADPAATVGARRDEVARRRAAFGAVSNRSTLYDTLVEVLDDVFVALEYIPIGSAAIYTLGSTYPFGTQSDTAPWYSTVARILVLCADPLEATFGAGTQTSGYFYQRVAEMFSRVEPLLPTWVTIDWYRAPTLYAAVPISGGPSAAGFYLDDLHNLDESIFDV